MTYAYFPGCSLKGSARKLNRGLKRVFSACGLTLKEIDGWRCCGALEHGDASKIYEMSSKNLNLAQTLSSEIVAPCPLCMKNLKESNKEGKYNIYHPLDILNLETILKRAKRDVSGQVFTPYYGCLLLRPAETAIKDKEVMEKIIVAFGGEVAGNKIKGRCCGGNRFLVEKDLTAKLCDILFRYSEGKILVFCPLCYIVLRAFSKKKEILYFTDFLLYLLGERKKI